MLEFHFTPTKADYIKTLTTMTLRQRSIQISLAIIGLILLIDIVGLLINFEKYVFTSLFFILLPIFFVVFLFINPLLVGRRVTQNERLRAETSWTVTDQDVTIHNQYSETRFDWGSFQKVIETQDYYLLAYSTNTHLFQILPKRAFNSPEQMKEFDNLLRTKLGRTKTTKAKIEP